MNHMPYLVKLTRALVGATWSIPLRYITYGAQLSATAMVAGVHIHVPMDAMLLAMTAGVMTGWALRVLDNMINEFLVFEWIKRRFFSRGKEV
jgi:hypothetical protein